MIGCPPDEPTLMRFIQAVAETPPRPHHSALLDAADRLVPSCSFSLALTRGGWYRPGGIVRRDGSRVAEDLERWAESELDDCGGDFGALLERHAEEGLIATRHAGRTLYFVAAVGIGPAEFLQLEVEEVQEMLDRELIDPRHPPEDLPDLTDPASPKAVLPQPLGPSRYQFRRLTDIRHAVARQPGTVGEPSALARFLTEWAASSASDRGDFCDHWIVALREHQDRYRNKVLHATPISRHARVLKSFHWNPEARGVALSEQLHAFDRVAGYRSAWYFHLVAGALTPRAVAFAIAHDLDGEFSYLPESEVRLLHGWLRAPYSV